MGTATSQKSFLKLKLILILVSIILTGIMMRLLSPPQKLDIRPYYSYTEATVYLTGLSEVQKQNYFYAELFDFWFMINYSWLLLMAFNKYVLRKNLLWLAFLPGILDLIETSLITYYLQFREFTLVHHLMPVFSSLKWVSAFLILLYLGKRAFWRRANR